MTHTIEQTADIQDQLNEIKSIHEQVAEAVNGKSYPCAMAALSSIMIDLYNAHNDAASIDDFVNKLATAYMADQYVNNAAKEQTKQ